MRSLARWVWKVLKLVLLVCAENVFAMVLVLLFFLVFMGILSLSFPRGTSLGDLVALPQQVSALPAANVRRGLEIGMQQGETTNPMIASLSNVRRRVKDRPANAIAWSASVPGTALGNRHSIQTLEQSAATITFGPRSEMQLGPNSLVVLKSFEETRGSNRKSASLIVLDGELRGRIEDSATEVLAVEVVSAGGSVSIRAEGAPGKRAEFKLHSTQDRASTLSLYEGVAEVVVAGETIVVEPNHAITMDLTKLPARPVPLPAAPEPVSPPDEAVFRYRSAPPRVEFRWTAPAGTPVSRFVLARDARFGDVVHEAEVDGHQFTHGNLKPGRYYWRLTGIREQAESAPSAPRSLRVTRDDEPPALSVDFPEGSVDRDSVVIAGTTEPGAEVFIKDVRIPVEASGEFSHKLTLDRGLNVVVVEAVDAAGNVSYRTQRINARF